MVQYSFEFLSHRNKSNVSVSYVPEVTYCGVLSPRKILGFIYIAFKYVVIFCFNHGITDKFSIFVCFASSSTVFPVDTRILSRLIQIYVFIIWVENPSFHGILISFYIDFGKNI